MLLPSLWVNAISEVAKLKDREVPPASVDQSKSFIKGCRTGTPVTDAIQHRLGDASVYQLAPILLHICDPVFTTTYVVETSMFEI
jgi:hypothetical protein